MKRREFSASLLSAGVGAAGFALSSSAEAQGAPVEGTNYVRLSPPVPGNAGGKIEVVAFEPMLDAWQKKVPPDVAFRRVPVAFRDEPYVTHQHIFYALDSMGLIPTMHRKVFYAIHNDRMRLDKLPDIAAFMAKNGVDPAKFSDAFNSFTVQTKSRQAAQLSEAYKIDGVPAMGVHGRYYTSGSLAGSNDKMLVVVEYLVDKIRKSG
jgi:thiol:disulfide interchange protein DsbA